MLEVIFSSIVGQLPFRTSIFSQIYCRSGLTFVTYDLLFKTQFTAIHVHDISNTFALVGLLMK